MFDIKRITKLKRVTETTSQQDLMKIAAEDRLRYCKRVIDALGFIGDMHPFVKPVFVCLQVILDQEIQRQENDKRASLVLLKQVEMCRALSKLAKIPPDELSDGRSSLKEIIPQIWDDIHECGNVIDAFSNQKSFGKMFKLLEFSGPISFLSAYTARFFHAPQWKITVATWNVDMKNILECLKQQTDQEARIALEVDKLGGMDKLKNDKNKLAKLNKIVGGIESPEGTKGRQGMAPDSIVMEIRTTVDTLIDRNRERFEARLQMATGQLERSIEKAEHNIIAAIGEGPWTRIRNGDIKQVWRGMKAPSSVKARHLILSLHDYYTDLLAEGLSHNVPAPEDNPPTSPDQTQVEANMNLDGLTTSLSIVEDTWCLEYISIGNVPAIEEAIDDDVSGFIKVNEVNEFHSQKPDGFSTLRWVTFWAAGWGIEATIYHNRIEKLVEKLLGIVVLPENTQLYAEYKDELYWVTWLLRSHRDETTENEELYKLIQEHMKVQENAITTTLEIAKWDMDIVGSNVDFMSGRIEKFLYPLLYLILRRHYQVFTLASKFTLHSKEFQSASKSIQIILSLFKKRTLALAESFNHRTTSVKELFERFAGGLFANWFVYNTDTSTPTELDVDGNNAPFIIQVDPESRMGYVQEQEIPEAEVESLLYGVVLMKVFDNSGRHRRFINKLKPYILAEYYDESDDDDESEGGDGYNSGAGSEGGDGYHSEAGSEGGDDQVEELADAIGNEDEVDLCTEIARHELIRSGLHACITDEEDETHGHRADHLFLRLSGEPLALQSAMTATETTLQQRIEKIEETLVEHGNLLRDIFDRLRAPYSRTDGPVHPWRGYGP
ncbi:hypothetical protein BU17DRAFT_88537 [Hysterangium stoloniferum]|nr:hypothetical protein BU17DRAFT_88537 [Hysterangium stoloniferum]